MKQGVFIVLVAFVFSLSAQQSPVNSEIKKEHKWRKPFLIATESAVISGGLVGLNYLWYEQYERTPFHFFNDNHLWLGMDKMGHCFSAYAIGSLNADIIRWAGGSKNTSIWLGGTSGLIFLSAIEMFDGFSEHWGFSWGDMIANTGGTALFISQQLLWNEQRFQLKYSFWPTNYSKDRPDLLGDNFAQQLMKDYNGQTYWLSANIWSFLPNREQSKFPKWLNIALGYGANGLLGGDKNPEPFAMVQRYPQFYLSLDVDLTKIPTKSKVLKTVFRTFNLIKFPAPAFEFNTTTDHPVRFHWLHF